MDLLSYAFVMANEIWMCNRHKANCMDLEGWKEFKRCIKELEILGEKDASSSRGF